MPIELSQLMMLADGGLKQLYVGELPRVVAQYLGANPGLVYLSSDVFWKVATRHPEIKREEFQSLHMIIKDGQYYSEVKRPNCVTIYWTSKDSKQPYCTALKAVGTGEVWVSTFHRTNPLQIERRARKHAKLHPK